MGEDHDGTTVPTGPDSVQAHLETGRTSDDGTGLTVVRDPTTPVPSPVTPSPPPSSRHLITVDWDAISGPARSVGRRWGGSVLANPRPWLIGIAAVAAVAVVWTAVVVVVASGRVDRSAANDRYRTEVTAPANPTDADQAAAKTAAADAASRAAALAQADPVQALRLQLVAYTLDPDNQRLPLVGLLARADHLAPTVTADLVLPAATPIVGAQLSPDGETLFTRGPDGATQLWDLSDLNRVSARGTLPTSTAPVAINENASTLVVAQSGPDPIVTVWGADRLISPRRLATLDKSAIDVVAISADGLLAVTAAGPTATIWAVGITARGRSESTFTTTAPITAAAFTANGRTLIIGDASGHVTTIALTDPSRPSIGRAMSGHTGKITNIRIGGDSSSVVTVDELGGIAAWTLGPNSRASADALPIRPAAASATAAPLRGGPILLTTPDDPAAVWLWTTSQPERWLSMPFPHPQPVTSVLSGDGTRAITVGAQGHITTWALDELAAALTNPGPRACDVVSPVTEQQWLEAVGSHVAYRRVC